MWCIFSHFVVRKRLGSYQIDVSIESIYIEANLHRRFSNQVFRRQKFHLNKFLAISRDGEKHLNISRKQTLSKRNLNNFEILQMRQIALNRVFLIHSEKRVTSPFSFDLNRRRTDFGIKNETHISTYKLVELLPCPRTETGESRTDAVPFGLPVPDINCQLKNIQNTSFCFGIFHISSFYSSFSWM